jgi:hypothetical protein
VEVGSERRLNIEGGSGDPGISLQMSASLAQLLGFASATTGISDSHVADSPPDGYVDIGSQYWHAPEPAKDIQVTRYRHGRTATAPWGSGTSYRIDVRLPRTQYVQLMEGPILTGRTRLQSGVVTAALSQTYPGGVIDGYVYDVRAEPMDDREAWYRVTLRILVPKASERTLGLETDAALEDTTFWGWLRYGYSVAYYARAEGIPTVFTELELGWSDADWSYHAGLVVDGAGRVGYEVDRTKGVGRSASLQWGILDPTNSTGYFGRPALRYTLAADLEPATTDLEVGQDISGAPSTGKLYLGKECLEYSGVSVGSQLFYDVDVKRGTWGPVYRYRTTSVQTWRTVTDVPLFWHGRFVELWATLVDPYGRPVDGAMDGDHSRQVFLGEIDGNPMWTGAEGRWDFTAHSLERRLTRKIGSEISGVTVARSDGQSLRETLVYVEAKRSFRISAVNPGLAPVQTSDTAFLDANTTYSVGEVVDALCAAAEALAATIGFTVKIWALPDSYNEVEPGKIVVNLVGSSASPAEITIVVSAVNGPGWMLGTTVVYCDGGTLPSPALTIYPQQAADSGHYSLFVRERPADYGTEPFPSAGYAIVDGPEGVELVRYDQKTAIDTLEGGSAVYRLRVTERGVDGTPLVDLTIAGLEVRAGIRLEGTAPDVMLQVLESSGIGDRGDYDVLDYRGQGYGLGTDYVDESLFQTLSGEISWAGKLRIVLGKEYSFESLFGGLLAAGSLAVAPVRGTDGRLRIGLARTLPVVSAEARRITDHQLLGRRPVTPRRTHDGPAVVKIKAAEATVGNSPEAQRVFRSVEAVDGYAGPTWEFEWHGLNPGFFDVLAPHVGKTLIDRLELQMVADFEVGPWQDWQVGDLVSLETSHPGAYDYAAGAMGVDGVAGRVLAVRRAIGTSAPVLSVLLDGAVRYGVLCPGVVVTGVAGSALLLDAGDHVHFQVGDLVLLYTPGDGTEWTTATVAAVVAGQVTLTSAPPAWVTADETTMTFPDEGAGSARQDAYVHVDDGSLWS